MVKWIRKGKHNSRVLFPCEQEGVTSKSSPGQEGSLGSSTHREEDLIPGSVRMLVFRGFRENLCLTFLCQQHRGLLPHPPF